MKKIFQKHKSIIYLSIIILVTILSLFSIIEYRWFNSIYIEEFKKTYNTLLLNTNRVSNREFERIEMYSNWLSKVNELNINEKALEDNLSNNLLNSNEFIINKDTIISIGYININNEVEKIFDGTTWTSNLLSLETKELIQDIENTSYKRDNELLSLYIRLNDNIFIIVNIDLLMYSQIYIIPSIEESNFDLVIDNFTQTNNQTTNDYKYNQLFELQETKFSPFKSIISSSNLKTQIIIPIINQEFNFNKVNGKSNEKPIDFPEELKLFEYNIFNIDKSKIYAYVTINVSTSDFYGLYIEKTLSYIYVGGIFLIGLIGFICLLLIYQLNRIQKQHQKEREFTASITHELRTPLTVIQSASDNLSSNLIKPERISSYGTLIKQQSNRLNSMIENLLVFSKIENNKAYKVNLTQVNLNSFLLEIEKHFKQIAKEKNITIKWTKININKEVLLDRSSYELIISNLINNSIFHAYNNIIGEIRITIQFSNQKNHLITSIEDDGRGIPYKEQKYIYDSYYRGEKSISTQERGSGLGLFIVKKNISILGGKIILKSPYKRLDGKIKNGCRFDFYIPCKETK